MREGRITERGTHQELLEQGGEYRKLVALQGLE
jgi:ABC-type multidrug transport system fused ATPase/permease subunit